MNYKTNVQPAPRLSKPTKADIILDLVMSLNRGNCGTIANRPVILLNSIIDQQKLVLLKKNKQLI